MDSIGLALHKRESQLCTVTEDGELVEQRIVTNRGAIHRGAGRPRAGAHSPRGLDREWVARHLETLGHTVIVADPGFAAMYATRSKRVKTDKRDARTLCEARQLGAYRAVHGASDAQRHLRAQSSRRSPSSPRFPSPRTCARSSRRSSRSGDRSRSSSPRRDDVKRFSERAPGAGVSRPRAERVQFGRPTCTRAHHQTGRRAHALAVGRDGVAILRTSNPALTGLKAWAQQIAGRRGKRIATVALARRVAGILYAMWRDDAPYPHEALQQDTPASRYACSARAYPSTLPTPEYPLHFLVKKVTDAGTFRFQRRVLYIANSLVDQHIGLEETDDGIWSIYFNSILLATLDERDYILRG